MNKYELTIITGEDKKDSAVKKEIESLGGKITDVQSLGQKQLAYPIKKETAGFYTAVSFEMAPEKILEFNRKLGLNNEIIRHLIITAKAVQTEPEKEKIIEKPKVKTTEIVEKPLAIEKEPADVLALVDKPEKEIIEAPKITKKPIKKEKTAEKTQEKPAEETASAEDRLKALDEKLKELLKE